MESNVTTTPATNICFHNIVKCNDLRKEQLKAMKYISEALLPSFGPYGSDTILCRGANITYTKDGRTIAESLQFSDIIAKTTLANILDVAVSSDKEVGDGTTSAILIACEVFTQLVKMADDIGVKNSYELRRKFASVCDQIKQQILKFKNAFTPEAAYEIAYISTNGDEKFAQTIKDIYDKYGNEATIHVQISTDEKDYIKTYDGMYLQAGFSDPVYVNSDNNECTLYNPRIYAFKDNIDTPDMCKLFSIIVNNNIMQPLQNKLEGKENSEMIPTVIITPRIGMDLESNIKDICTTIASLKQNRIEVPFLIVTQFYDAVGTYEDIAGMCGCRMIKKYIDKNVYDYDKEQGLAPTDETVVDFYGSADVVISDSSSTRFINPHKMFKDENKTEYSAEYNSLVSWLEKEIETAVERGRTVNDIGNFKNRLASLKSNLIDLYIGGASLSDRDQKMALVEDAVKNCQSASKHGYGYGANFEALRAADIVSNNINDNSKNDPKNTDLKALFEISKIIFVSIASVVAKLYWSRGDVNGQYKYIDDMLYAGHPFDITAKEFGQDTEHPIYTSIMTDYTIIDNISKIVVLIYGSNQLLTDAPSTNKYMMNYQPE